MKAILIVSHGSHSLQTKIEVEGLVRAIKQRIKIPVDYAFLEIEAPSIPEGIKQSIEKGAKEIVVLLNFLNSGKHVDEDIPRIIADAEKKYPDVRFKITKPVGQHHKMTELFLDLIQS